MVEIISKYKIGSRRFGLINWIGAWTLYKKEVLRFLTVWIQTILSPIITSILFLVVLTLAIGSDRGDLLGESFVTFLAPGLIAMQVIQQAFSHSASSFMIKKIDGTIVDILYAPLSAGEVTVAIILSAVTRSVMIAFLSVFVFYFIVEIKMNNIFLMVIFTLLSSLILGSIGMIAGLWAEKFDHMASATNFVIVPLSFLSGTFYTIDRLPAFLQTARKVNPFFYMIDGFRSAFLDKSDSSIFIGLIYLSSLALIFLTIAYILFKKGYKTKS